MKQSTTEPSKQQIAQQDFARQETGSAPEKQNSGKKAQPVPKGRQKLRYSYLCKEGAKGVFQHAFMSFAAICVMVACLIIMGSFTLVAMNLDALIDRAESENEILVYVDETLEDAQARSIGTEINKLGNVEEAKFVSREEAFESYQERVGEEGSLLEGLEENPLRHRYRVYLKDLALMGETVEQLKQLSGVAEVNARVDISESFLTARSIVNGVCMALSLILLVISLFIISNTVKLATFDRREEIAIMKMVGATNGFIRIPFIIEGMILGLLGAGIAFLLQWGLYDGIVQLVVGTVSAAEMIQFTSLILPTLVIFILVGLLVGVGGSVLTIRRYLKV